MTTYVLISQSTNIIILALMVIDMLIVFHVEVTTNLYNMKQFYKLMIKQVIHPMQLIK